MKKVAINGLGRIGRLVLRLIANDPSFEIVAINDLGKPEDLAYLLKYDTVHGNFMKDSITHNDNSITINGKVINIYSEQDAANLPWVRLGVDLVFECSGFYASKEKCEAHISAGAKKVIISAPAEGDLKTIVFNVNHEILDGKETIISGASCTTNALAPVLKVLHEKFVVRKAFMSTVHAYTNDQSTLDVAHRSGIAARRGRAAAENIVPTSTGAAKAIGLVIPELNNKVDGIAFRVPVATGSLIDLTLDLERDVTAEEVNNVLRQNVNTSLDVNDDPIVSSDIIGSLNASVVDSRSTVVMNTDDGNLVKVVSWYDNEMGYTAQMIRTAKYWLSKS